MTTCHQCGTAMVRDIRLLEITYKGHTFTVQQPGWYCTACGEGVLEPADCAVTQGDYVAFRDRVNSILS